MNWLTALFSGADSVKVVGDTLDKLFTNDDAREKALEMQKAQQAFDLAEDTLSVQLATNQTDINKVEAASTNSFVSSWRPAIGWVCCVAFSYSYIIEPVSRFIAQVGFGYTGLFPLIDLSGMYPVLMGMLGLGYMRTHEKINGVASK